MVYIPRTDEEIKQIAMDMKSGLIFTSDQCSKDLVSSVFMVLIFMSKEAVKGMQLDKIVLFYEYMSKAGPRAVNGCPVFVTAQTLNRADVNRVQVCMKRLEKVLAEV